ncbi:uncharacterized protein METZ01_LOCUS237026 [marine metagenome]|uniref:Uncharacterized protein n=1 Tax=marine metagenome TaxID=408172 RepID=A0A382HAG6_9ZZZZ
MEYGDQRGARKAVYHKANAESIPPDIQKPNL